MAKQVVNKTDTTTAAKSTTAQTDTTSKAKKAVDKIKKVPGKKSS